MATTIQPHSTSEISASFALWNEYVNPDGGMSEAEFDELSIQEKNKMQFEMFPGECDDVDADGNEVENDENDSDDDE